MTTKAPTFEQAFQRLGKIVETLEQGDISLDDSFKLWAEGMEMAKECRKQLESSQKKIEKLVESMSGTLSTEDVEWEEDEEADE